jgi:peptide/nickel transport system substrate-binding protein
MRARLLAAVAVLGISVSAGVVARRHGSTMQPHLAGGGRIVASIRAEPRSFNRLVARDQTTMVLTYLMHSGLVRVNRATDALEPELAERWELLPDQRTFRVRLRQGIAFSDGAPFSAADVLFSLKAVYDARTESILADSLLVAGQPLHVRAEDASTVLIEFPAHFGPGLRLLDGVPMLPRHKLERALDDGVLRAAWGPATLPSELAGLGPFVLREYRPGQQLRLGRNPHYWRHDEAGPLPRANEIVLQILPDQEAESLALQTGAIDFTQSELRPADVPALRGSVAAGRLIVSNLGTAADGDLFWINLGASRRKDPRSSWLQHVDFRRAIAHAIDREEFVNTVFLGVAVPGFGVVSPGNRAWFIDAPSPRFDIEASRALLANSLHLTTRTGVLVDRDGSPVRFTILTQRGNTALERGASLIRDGLSRLGVQVDVVGLEAGALVQRLMSGDYDAAYFRLLTTDTDPALNADFWRSSGSAHVWNPAQPKPATQWEAAIDALMNDVETGLDPESRRRAFHEIQRIMAREVPAICFAFPQLPFALSTRLAGATPAPSRPPVLWNPAALFVTDSSGRH